MNVRAVDQEDRDLEIMTEKNKVRRREEDEKRTAVLYSDAPFEEVDDLIVHRQHRLRHVIFTFAHAAPGLLFLGAIPRGWMDPAFALIMTAATFVGAVIYYRRGYRYGE